MGNTLVELRAQCRALLASTVDWPDGTLDVFIGDAIRFYSSERPWILRSTVAMVTGTQVYDLPGNMLRVLSVEYPAGEWPARFLTRAPEGSRTFLAGGAVYDVRGAEEGIDPEQPRGVFGQIVLGPTVATAEDMVLTYAGLHQLPDSDDKIVTVPQAHWEALIAFVDFRCHWELETDEAVTLSGVAITLSQLGENARRAWNRFKEIMARYEWTERGQSAIITWDNSRIY